MSIKLKKIVNDSREAFGKKVNTIKKDRVLKLFANLILENKRKILSENNKDIKFAKKINLKENLIDRLEINKKKSTVL